MKTQRELAEERRSHQLEEIDRQVRDGQLVIRPMTPEERRRFPPRDPTQPVRTRRWRRDAGK